MLTKIDVTQADIINGVRMECTCCPVALAINKHLKPIFNSSVRTGYIIIRRKATGSYSDSDVLSTENNAEMREFIRAFDVRGHVNPITFELDIPDKFLAQGVDN